MRVSSLDLERPYVAEQAGRTPRYPLDIHCTEMPPAMHRQSIKLHTTCIHEPTGVKVMLDWWIVQVVFMYQPIDQWEEICPFCVEPSESHTVIPIAWQAALLAKCCACFFVRANPSYCNPLTLTRAVKKDGWIEDGSKS